MSTVNPRPIRVGWIVDSAPARAWSFPWQSLGPVSAIRYGNLARYIHRTDPKFRMERYLPFRRYDAVVFIKKLNEPCLELARRLKERGAKIVFDSNVNYYEVWGDYDVPGTEPRADQMRWAQEMTQLVDFVVADSSYLAEQCRKWNPHVAAIPDAVDADVYAPSPNGRTRRQRLRLVWSGISKKAQHLELIEDVLAARRDALELHLVINRPHPHDPPSPVIDRLKKRLTCEVTYFSNRGYVEDLRRADLIISPKILSSAYEMAHTEYKITLGMAVGLPALASPQPSYQEALAAGDGGWICRSPEDWGRTLDWVLAHRDELITIGQRARRRVLEHYAVPVVAEQYKAVLLGLR